MRLLLSCFFGRQPTELTGKGSTPSLSSCSTAPPRASPPMATAGSAPSWEQKQAVSQRHTSKPSPLRFTSDERKIVLAELASLEDIRLFDAGQMPRKTHKKAVDACLVPRLDFSCLPGGAAARRQDTRQSQSSSADVQPLAQVAAPAEASPEALHMMQPPSKPVEAAIACLGPLAMLPPKPAAMRREFVFV